MPEHAADTMTPIQPPWQFDHDPGLRAAAAKALELILDGSRVGLGTGRAASVFIAELGARAREGLRVTCVPTSEASAARAREAGLCLVELGEEPLDITVDGADEVAPDLDLVKGWGGALVPERIVAAASARQVILVGDEKLVESLGERGRVPVEVIPLARGLVTRSLRTLGLVPTVRMDGSGRFPFLTETGHLIIDCAPTEPIGDGQRARNLERALLAIGGVVDTGLFLGTAERVLVGYPDGHVAERHRPKEGTGA